MWTHHANTVKINVLSKINFEEFMENNVNITLDTVCLALGVTPDTIAKKESRLLRAYTYRELIHRVITTDVRIRDEFSEMNETTALKMLKAAFPGKPASYKGYDKYLLSIANLKKCLQCSSIKPFAEFNKSKRETDGMDSRCRLCYRTYYTNNKEDILAQKKEYGAAHLPQKLANNAKRRALLIDRVPAWADTKEISTVYLNCPSGYHVDHIIPLQGELVCGLHVEHNLQYLLAAANMSKGNTFDIEAYAHTIEYVRPY